MTDRLFPKTVVLSHSVVEKVVGRGDTVVDATAGNGHDTVFLAGLVGPEGRVYSFDIQPEALKNTQQRLMERGLGDRVVLLCKGHETMDREVPRGIKAVMFNLGFLPGGDHGIITKPETTIAALQKSLQLLTVGGVISVVVYMGHPGGVEESTQVEKWSERLDSGYFDVVKFNYLNKPNNPPYFICIQKLLEKDDKDESQPSEKDTPYY